MAANDALTEGQVSRVNGMILEALREYTGGLRTEVQQLQVGTIATINVRIDEAHEIMNDVQQRMFSSQEGCKRLLETVKG